MAGAVVCVLGSINMDLVVCAPRLPAPGETILGGTFDRHGGGKGANQAVAAARMGARVSLIGAVGDDEHGGAMMGTLAAEGIDTSRIARRAGVPTGVGMIAVSACGENTIVVAPGANMALAPADVDAAREEIAGADVLLMQLESPPEVVAHAAAVAREVGTTVVLNAAPARALPRELLADVDVLIVNEGEARALANGGVGPDSRRADDPGVLLDVLAALGPALIVLTLGGRGAAFARGAGGRDGAGGGVVPAFAVDPVDTVGAGDAFAGALAVRLAEHQAADATDRTATFDAICWACAAGALATTVRGAIPSLPMRPAVAAMLKRGGDARAR